MPDYRLHFIRVNITYHTCYGLLRRIYNLILAKTELALQTVQCASNQFTVIAVSGRSAEAPIQAAEAHSVKIGRSKQ